MANQKGIAPSDERSDALRLSEDRLRTVLRAAPVGIGFVENRIIQSANEQACAITGYTLDELIGMDSRDLYESREEYERLGTEGYEQQQQSAIGMASIPTRFRRKDGSLVNVLVNSTAVEPKDPSAGAVFSIIDITEQKRAEEARVSHLRFLENMQQVDRVIQQETDVDRMTSDILQVTLEMFGADRAWLLYPCDPDAESWSVPMERTRPEYPGAFALGEEIPMLPEAVNVFRNALDKDDVIILDSRDPDAPKATDELFSILTQMHMAVHPRRGKPWMFGLHQCSHHRDWTDEEKDLFREIGHRLGDALSSLLFLRDLQQSEERIGGILRHSPSVIFLKDTNGRYLLVNRRYEELFHVTNEEIQGKTDYDIFPKEAADAFRENDQRVISSGMEMLLDEVAPHDDGMHAYLALKYPVRNREGEVIGVCGIATDVTERKHAEEERDKLEDQLRQAQKMEAVGQLAGGVAHDFNNLLQVILGYADLLLLEIPADGPHHRELQHMRDAANQAADLTRQLLAYGRRQMIQPKDTDLNALIDDLLKMMRRLIGEHIELDFLSGHGLGTVHVDRAQIQQVLMNLCVNARDAMPKGGKLTIETENVLINGEYVETHPWSSPGRYVLLSVTDTGCGIEPEILNSIFDPFFTTKEIGKGTGLGLATVYGIVKQHDGQINAYSEIGKGTIFKIYLPIVERRAVEVTNSSPDAVPGGTETILVAEDDEKILALASRLLHDAGYSVLTARNGLEAVRVFEEHADEIDMVLIDVVMPKLGGREAVNRILERSPGLPHLYASGYSENAVHTNFIQEQGLRLIQKPYQRETLLREVREALDA